MMETMNISLPKPLAKEVDSIVKKDGYASRSELFRTLLRMYTYLREPQTITLKDSAPLATFKTRPLGKVKEKLSETNLYSEAFIESVVSGLRKSSKYAGKTTS